MSIETRGAEARGAPPLAGRRDLVTLLDSTYVLGAVLLAFAAGVTFFVYKDAWVSDDAVITFRYVDNLLHGHGASLTPATRYRATRTRCGSCCSVSPPYSPPTRCTAPSTWAWR